MKKIWPIIFTTGSALLLSGCLSNPVKLSDYSARQLIATDPLPTKQEIKADRARVVIFEPKINGNKVATKAKLDESVAVALDEHISETGTEIIDRSIAQTLKKELQLAEIKGKSEYTGPNIADYAITGKITEANLASKFVAASQWQNEKGETYNSPAKCKYTANVKASLRIYKLPALHYLKTIIIEDAERISKDPQGTKCALKQNDKNTLFREAANGAVKKTREEFQNFFAPKAYVLERRAKEDDSIFKISKGKANGFNPDDSVKLYHLDTSTNPLTGEANAHEYEIVTGTISNLAGDHHAWVLVEDKNAADQVKLGDYAKTFYEKGMFESAMNFVEDVAATADQYSGGGATKVNTPAAAVGVPAGSGAGLPASNGVTESYQADWGTTPAHFGVGVTEHIGQDFGYACPPNGKSGAVFGSDTYGIVSQTSICTAAVHSGLITFKSGGNVTIRIIRHKGVLLSTDRNNIVSYSANSGNSIAFIFLNGETINSKVSNEIQEVDAEWDWTASEIGNRLGQDFAYTCPPRGAIYSVWGTDKYMYKSSVCGAAVHAGIITARAGGRATIRIVSSKKKYKGSHRNGVQSSNYPISSYYQASFIFLK